MASLEDAVTELGSVLNVASARIADILTAMRSAGIGSSAHAAVMSEMDKNKGDMQTLLLVNLSELDHQRFHQHRIQYSGSTGGGTRGTKLHPDLERVEFRSYIATYMSELRVAVDAMMWEEVELKHSGGQWIARKLSI